jgi:hypothetical protein
MATAYDEARLRAQIERELIDTMRLQRYGTLARVYDCTSHVPSLISRNHCRNCWTELEKERT